MMTTCKVFVILILIFKIDMDCVRESMLEVIYFANLKILKASDDFKNKQYTLKVYSIHYA